MTEWTGRGTRVLVGVDGSPPSKAALTFALTEARLRGATLIALLAVEIPDRSWLDPYAIGDPRESRAVPMAEDALRAMLVDAGTDGVDVEPVVTTTSAPAALVERSADCDLLVVGSRGHGGFRGLVLGSVSMQCVLHAHCPVTVVRPEPDPAPGHHTIEDARQDTTAPFL